MTAVAVLALSLAAADRPYSFVVRTPRAPVLDGKPDDVCWQSAAPISDFGLSASGGVRSGGYVTPPMEVRLLWDDEYLYIAAKSWEDADWNIESHRAEATASANAFYDRDTLEIGN